MVRPVAAVVVTIMLAYPGTGICATQRPPADIVITSDEIANAPGSGGGEYFTVDSQQEDVVRVQGEPDDKFFDGRYFEWYYGPDTVYIDFYGRVVGADNKDGKLKFQ